MGKEAVQQIKDRLGIVDVVSSYIPVEKTGSNARAKCPFHNEKTPSFFLSPDRGTYYCFGCGVKGDIFSFVQEFEGLDFKGALKVLASRAGVSLSDSYNPGHRAADYTDIYRCLSVAASFFESTYESSVLAKEYVSKRSVSEETRRRFRIGYAPLEWRMLYEHLKKEGFSDTQIEQAGLVKKTEKGFYDRFRGRLMFPLADSSGRIIAFSGRILVDDGKSAKYVNSPETVLFTKGSILYGFDKAKESIRKRNYAILVEGQFDLVLAHQSGFENTVATSGTAVSDAILTEGSQTHFTTLKRISNNLVIAFDGDRAGQAATVRAARIALSLGMDVKTLVLPEGKDPADIFVSDISLWRDALTKKKQIIESLTDAIWTLSLEERKKLILLSEKVFPLVLLIQNPVEQAYFIKYIARRIGVLEEVVLQSLNKMRTNQQLQPMRVETEKKAAEDPPEKILFGLLTLIKVNPKFAGIDPLLLDKAHKSLSLLGDNANNFSEDETEALLFKTEQLLDSQKNFSEVFQNTLTALEEKRLHAIVRSLAESLKRLENSKENTQVLLEEYSKKSRELEELRAKRRKDML